MKILRACACAGANKLADLHQSAEPGFEKSMWSRILFVHAHKQDVPAGFFSPSIEGVINHPIERRNV